MPVSDKISQKPQSLEELNNVYLRNRIIATVVVLVVLAVSLYTFLKENERRVIDTNTWYAESTTTQTANLVNEMMLAGQDSIGMIATIYQGQNLANETDTLNRIINDTLFDNMSYCDANGVVYGSTGSVRDAREQPYYLEGMAGKSGIEPIHRIRDGEIRIMAYAPIKNDAGEIMGVIVGSYANDRLSETISEKFFGENVSSYLCMDDGAIICKSVDARGDASNVVDLYAANEEQATTAEELTDALANHQGASYTFLGDYGTGVAYVAPLADFDLLVVSAFPTIATAGITDAANQSGIILIVIVLILFLAFIGLLVWQNHQQNQFLESENRQLDRMVSSITHLFQRFIVVDLPADSYRYIKSDGLGAKLTQEGHYSDFYNFWMDRIDPRDRETMKEFLVPHAIQEHLKVSKEGFLQSNYRLIDADGVARWKQMSILAVTSDEHNVPLTLLLTIQDINETMEKEEKQRIALQEAFSAAEQANSAKTDFLNSMSHDIRTPMNSIMGLTAIATMYIDDPARVADCLDKISASSRHLLGLINEVLDMAKIESGTIELAEEEVDLPETVQNLLTIMHPQAAAKHLDLKVDISNIEHEHVIGDPMRLQQVFVNIMGNSIKFTPSGGTVGLYIRELPSTIAGSGHYEFKFTDTGVGMSQEFVKKVFEPFARAHDTRVSKTEGTGLGMAIVKNVVNLMNGTIDVQSQLGQGTVFTVDVYMRLRDVAHEDVSGLAGLRILVADDDQVACEGAATMLQEIGMKSEWVLSGDEAIAAVTAAADENNRYMAVILDWKMPGKSGIETAKEIRQSMGEDLPIIILSAYDWSAIEQEARRTGVNAFISKPLFRSRLVHVLKELLLKYEEENTDDLESLQRQDFSGHNILLVEDNPLAAAIAEEILEVTHVDVEHAENGKDAVDLLTSLPPHTFDLVLMDVQMPVMNGYEATAAIRAMGTQERPDLATIPIIALTADAFSDDVRKATKAGMNAHMSKPMEIGVLIEMLNHWLTD